LSDILGGLEFLGNLAGFWLFIFSKRVRVATLARWRDQRGLSRALIPVEILVATLCGLFPLAFVYYLLAG
jgi:hypothetical protein